MDYSKLSDEDLLKEVEKENISLSTPKKSFFESVVVPGAKGIAGATIGAAESFNPLNFPRSIEALGRGIGKTAAKAYLGEGFHPIESLGEAEEESVMPDLSVKKFVAPAIRTSLQAPGALAKGGFDELGSVFRKEKASQELFQEDPAVSTGQTIGELGSLGIGLGVTLKNSKTLSKIGESLNKLKGLKAADEIQMPAFNLSRLKEAKDFQKQLLGDLAPEMEEAIFENTKEVRNLYKGPQEGRSILSTVDNMRNQLKVNKDLLGDAIGEFRYAIVSDKPQLFDQSLTVKGLKDFINSQRLSGGTSILDPRDQRVISEIGQLLVNPNKRGKSTPVTTRDATLIVDKIDDHLKKAGYYEGKNLTKTNQFLHTIRSGIDEELASMYPAYKEMKGRYKSFIDDYSQVQSRIEGMGAESFVGNLFGRNKTETRELLERLMNQGEETAKAFKNSVKDGLNFSDAHQNYNLALLALEDKAAGIKFQSGKDLMKEIANKAAARKLSDVGDKDADILRNLINQYVEGRVEGAVRKVEKAGLIGTGVGGTVGGWMGLKLGGPQSAMIGSGSGGLLGNLSAKGFVRAMQGDVRGKALREAESIYNIDRLFDVIEKSKEAAPETKKLFKGAQWISSKFGPEAAESFLNKVGLTSTVKNDLEKAAAIMGSVGAARSIAEDYGFEIRPRKNFRELLKNSNGRGE